MVIRHQNNIPCYQNINPSHNQFIRSYHLQQEQQHRSNNNIIFQQPQQLIHHPVQIHSDINNSVTHPHHLQQCNLANHVQPRQSVESEPLLNHGVRRNFHSNHPFVIIGSQPSSAIIHHHHRINNGNIVNINTNTNIICSDTLNTKLINTNTNTFNNQHLPFKCNQCEKQFKRRENLKSHIKLHASTAPKCQYCGKQFSRKSNLRQHILIHTNERPFKCNYCNKAFRQKHVYVKKENFFFLCIKIIHV